MYVFYTPRIIMSPPHIPQYKMIVALCRGGGIGYQGTLPWPKIERDLRFFFGNDTVFDIPVQ